MLSIDETIIGMRQACGLLNIRREKFLRFVNAGERGVRLDAQKVGSTWKTTRQACQRFLDELAALDAPAGMPQPEGRRKAEARHQKRDHDQAERELDRLGVGGKKAAL